MIICPSCRTEFEPTEAIREELQKHLRQQYERMATKKRRNI
jgi:hypothetical protein